MSYSDGKNHYYPTFKTFSNMSKLPSTSDPLRKNAEEDIERRKTVALNLRKAVKKRATWNQFSKEVTEYYGSSMESVKNVLEGKRSIRAEELLFMESNLGIHRDEILGKINDSRLHRKSLKQLDERILVSRKDAEIDGNELASKLNLLLNAIHFKLENKATYKEKENFCEMLLAVIPRI